jgi:hypothetical protein
MEIEKLRKVLLWLFVGFLGLTALIAIATVLIGKFDETDAKVLGTTFTISAACILSMACAAFIEKQGITSLGIAGMSTATLAAVMVIVAIWAEVDSEIYLKCMGTLIVLAVGMAHAFLLTLPDLKRSHRWSQFVALLLILILGLQIIYAIWIEPDQEFFFRVMAVFVILVTLVTLGVPILMLIGKAGAEVTEVLVLKHRENDLYADTDGVVYKVKRVEGDQGSISPS